MAHHAPQKAKFQKNYKESIQANNINMEFKTSSLTLLLNYGIEIGS